MALASSIEDHVVSGEERIIWNDQLLSYTFLPENICLMKSFELGQE